ncbi:c-type cytochrome [Erythrobacter gaetbuli]|uniref:C-type cytochrome n=1 Tax=Qipengyuania gaetbuli TaxID=266952 RepID=A0A844XX95_9SPHN|nr:c-type cytochrome [Qipengyuania gaetbuli]MXO49733.1 c-type cytochrome [Qipengyuania gaetbuli]
MIRAVAATIIVIALLGGCSDRATDIDEGQSSLIAFDGADYKADAEKLMHGERMAEVFACNSCHLEDYTGANFGEMIPLVEGLWATNISLTMPQMSDAELELILREGKRSDRELYLMPSRQTHFLSEQDMSALIAFLRTIKPAGAPTPEPPAGFADAVADRLPRDYWREKEYGRRFYPSAADEVAYYVANRVPNLGSSLERGRYIATTVCSVCHGAALDGKGENSGDVQAALSYDGATFDALLGSDMTVSGPMPPNEWGGTHAAYPLTPSERTDIYQYVFALAESRAATEK